MSGFSQAVNYEKQVDELMNKMTLTDKVGEMTQLTLDMLCVGEPYNVPDPVKLDPKKVDYILNELKVGSILNVTGHAFDRQTWDRLISEIQRVATKEKSTGIPILYGIDAIHGNNYTIGATLFPQQINLANTWNLTHARNTGIVTGYEAKASSIPWCFSPVFDIARDPRWPRFWETYGEDPYLSGVIGSAVVKGMQGDDVSDPYKAAACMKHFLGYSQPLKGTDRTPAWIPERFLLEYFTPSFKAAIDAGAKTIMINSGEVNGIPVHANKAILVDLLRDKLGFKGLAVSDWEDIKYLYTRHKVAENHKDAIRIAINAGIDMSMVPTDAEFPILLKELVEEGKVPMERINESVKRILTLKFELGLFETPVRKNVDYSKFASKEFQKMSLDAAVESLVLLKNNEATLPISKSKKVLITGPTSNSLNYLNGGWTGVWQGNNEKYNTPGKQTIKEAFEMAAGPENVVFQAGASYDKLLDIDKTIEAAKQVDYIIACVGEKTYTETPGNIKEINLPDAQNTFIERLASTGKPVILVYVGGRPRIIRQMVDKSAAVIAAMLPGNEGGHALAKIIFGDENPSGKLSFTYPRYSNDLLPYDYKGTDRIATDFSLNGVNPQFEFAHGLSYTSFSYSNLKMNKDSFSENETMEISIDVKNTGGRKGKEVVPVFISDLVASITPPAKKLRAFDKISLGPGEMKTVKFSVPVKRLAFVGQENKWIVEAGKFNLQIGDQSREFIVK